MATINLVINGKKISKEIPDNTMLSDFIRDNLSLTGTHVGCDTSQCGACVVHLNGNSVKSCTTLVADCEGSEITTIEGLSEDNSHPVQQAWIAEQVPQCGYCQSGQILTAVALLSRDKNPSEEKINRTMNGLCRCGTYPRIKKAITRAGKLMEA